MRAVFYALLLFMTFLVSVRLPAQNILISDSAFCNPNDTVVISIGIENSQQFISFQFDIQTPDNVTLIENSLQLSVRRVNHIVTGNMVESNVIRVLAYSPDNSAFLSNAGEVLTFKLAIGNIAGKFPLNFSNAVIGDSFSTNILTGVQGGILTISPLGINENLNSSPIMRFNVFPNPVKDNAVIEFTLSYPSIIRISLNDCLGRQLFSESMGEFSEGIHRLNLSAKICSKIIPGDFYLLGLKASTQKMAHNVVYKKILQ